MPQSAESLEHAAAPTGHTVRSKCGELAELRLRTARCHIGEPNLNKLKSNLNNKSLSLARGSKVGGDGVERNAGKQ